MNNDLEFAGFETQDKLYDCGAHAIRHSVLSLGIPCVHDNVIRTAGTLSNWGSFLRYGSLRNAGTSERQICNAIRRLGYDLSEVHTPDLDKAKRFLDESLGKGSPVILSVDAEGHWIAAMGRVGNHYLVVDSWDWHKYSRSNKAVSIYRWEELWDRRWYENCPDCGEEVDDELEQGQIWCTECDGYMADRAGRKCTTCNGTGWLTCTTCKGHGYWHYGVSVIPKDEILTGHSAVNRAELFSHRLVADQGLQEYWGYFLADLLDCQRDISGADSGEDVPIASLLDESSEAFIHNASHWLSGVGRAEIAHELSNYILIAKAYDMQVPRVATALFMQNFTMAFTMTLAEWYVF